MIMMNKIEYLLLLLAAVLLPWDWSYSLYGVVLLFLMGVAKTVRSRKFLNPMLDAQSRWPILALIALVGWYAVSLLWTANTSEGVEMVVTKSSMLLASLWVLCSDTSYLTRRHLRALLYLFAASLVVLFFVRLGINIRRVVTEPDTTWVSRMCFGFDKRHHSYISIYILVALWGLYHEQISRWRQMPRSNRTLWVALVLLLVVYLIVINSRAGVLFLLLSLFLMAAHAWLHTRRIAKPLLSLCCALVVAVGVHYALPKTQNRVNQTSVTAEAAAKGTTEQASRPDKRLAIWQASLRLAKSEWPLGVGVGDRFDNLKPIYEEFGDQESIDRRKNSHNQFLDTLVSTGIVGLAILLLFFASLLYVAWRSRSWQLFVFALCLGFNCLFETLLDRQMALFFIPLVIGLLMCHNKLHSTQS